MKPLVRHDFYLEFPVALFLPENVKQVGTFFARRRSGWRAGGPNVRLSTADNADQTDRKQPRMLSGRIGNFFSSAQSPKAFGVAEKGDR
jgi:hypothetical protein